MVWSRPTGRLAVVDIDTFELEVVVAHVRASRVNAMFVRDHFPELHHIRQTFQPHINHCRTCTA